MSNNNNDIYFKLVINKQRNADSEHLPIFVAPKNPNSPEGKNWTIGAKLPDGWYNQCAFAEEFDENGNVTIINVKLSPSNTGSTAAKPRGQQQSFGNNRFAKGQGSGYKQKDIFYRLCCYV